MPGMLLPNVDRYMTREPYSVASTDSLARARHLMSTHGIRHLPVVDGAELMGVISDRDMTVVASVPGVDLARVEVARVMGPAVSVWIDDSLDQVSDLMAEKKCNCVVVRGGRGVTGIFTAVDALQALADVVRRTCA